ncbi:MAG: signal peptidase I [Actinomycetota bacterium]
MADEPNNRWASRPGEPPPADEEPLWPPPPLEAGEARADTMRLQTGRFTSPSLGSYDSAAGANPLDSAGTDVDNGYFDQFGYGNDYGDGSFNPQGTVDQAASPGAAYEPEDAYGAYRDEYAVDDDFDDEELELATDARRNAIEWAVVLVGAVLLALILRAVLLQAFWIPSPSMESTLLVRDRVLVNKISYRLHDINRGDVIVFRRTDAEIAADPELPRDVIKRVIALEGETIDIVDNTVYIDGVALNEPYLDEGVITSDFQPTLVPEGHVFVMGDNRELSLDSRFETGPIAHDRVVGRAFFLFWPLDRVGSL